jgi:hypothetical protein
MLVFEGDKVMPFGGRRRLMDDDLPGDPNARLLVRVFRAIMRYQALRASLSQPAF